MGSHRAMCCVKHQEPVQQKSQISERQHTDTDRQTGEEQGKEWSMVRRKKKNNLKDNKG